MPAVILAVKIRDNFQLRLVEKSLKSTLKGLQIEAKIRGVTKRGWVQIDVSGEDEKVALHYLAEEIGLCPPSLDGMEKFALLKSRITSLEKEKDELHADIGIFSPPIIDAVIPLRHLQAQLVDGKEVTLRRLTELFGFCRGLPLTIKVLNIDNDKKRVEVMLSEKQLAQYRNWIKSLLDRLIIIDASIYDVKLTLKKAGLHRDILAIEPLGMFEFAVKCKLGTDAAGLIPKIGKNLSEATFAVFNPKRILEFLNYSASLIF